jgi:hypothetical protein
MTFGTGSAVVQMEEATRQNAAVVEDAPAAAQAMQRRVLQARSPAAHRRIGISSEWTLRSTASR